MKLTLRAAGSAAALFCAITAIAVAQPSQALDTEVAPLPARYTDHATAMVQLVSGDADGFAAPEAAVAPAAAVDFATPVASHAAALIAETDTQPGALSSAASNDADRETRPRASLAALVEQHGDVETEDAEHDCLARAVYFESKGEPLEGQLAVAEVIINRAESGRYPETLCGVVKQRSQFSFVRGGAIPSVPRSAPAWRRAVAIASIAREDLAESRTPNAMFFHARHVAPGWRGVRRLASIGNHVFYR